MSWRRPWATERRKLFAAAAWDAIVLLGLYVFIYKLRLGEIPPDWGGLAKTTTAWICLSYLFGRYSGKSDKDEGPIGRSRRVLGVAVIMIGGTLAVGWATNSTEAATKLKGFLLPLLAGSMLLSEFFLAATKSAVKKRGVLIIAPKREQTILKKVILTMGEESGRIEFDDDSAMLKALRSEGEASREVVISDSNRLEDGDIEEVLAQKGQGREIFRLIEWSEIRLGRIPPELASREWLMNEVGMNLQAGSLTWRIKRLGDVTAGMVLISALVPIAALVAILIYLEDKGPVLYRQKRTGLHGKTITIWKFRSMKVDAEVNGAVWSGKGDKRITNVGRFIRRCRIDEIPQLIGVLRGELSLIGPRPERPEIEEVLERQIPHYRARHWIRPGLSGWAQVSYPYGASIEDTRNKLAYDLYYLKNAGIGLDLLIFAKTIRLVMFGKGAIAKDRHNRINR